MVSEKIQTYNIQISKLENMKYNVLRIVSKVILIILGVSSLIFQLFYFIFSTLNRSSNDVRSRILSDSIPHFFTLIICVWFIIYQIRAVIQIKQYLKQGPPAL